MPWLMGSKKREAARGAAAQRRYDELPGTCRMHNDKAVWATKQIAKRVIRALPGDRGVMNAYRCSHTGGWHVGHSAFKGRNDD